MPQVSARVASRWTRPSIVSIRFVPGSGSRTVSMTSSSRPEASRSTSWVPYSPRSCVLERRLHAGLADDVVAQVALGLEPLELLAVDRPGVADDVRHQPPGLVAAVVEVATGRLDLDHDPGQLLGLLAEDQRRAARDAALDRHEVVRRALEGRQALTQDRCARAGDLARRARGSGWRTAPAGRPAGPSPSTTAC